MTMLNCHWDPPHLMRVEHASFGGESVQLLEDILNPKAVFHVPDLEAMQRIGDDYKIELQVYAEPFEILIHPTHMVCTKSLCRQSVTCEHVLWLIDQLASFHVSSRYEEPLAETRIGFSSDTHTYWVQARVGNEWLTLNSPWGLLEMEQAHFRPFLEQQIQLVRSLMVFGTPDLGNDNVGAYTEWSVVIKRLLILGCQNIREEELILLEMEKLKRLAQSAKLFQRLKEGIRRGEDKRRDATNAIIIHNRILNNMVVYTLKKGLLSPRILKQYFVVLSRNLAHLTDVDQDRDGGRKALEQITESHAEWDILGELPLNQLDLRYCRDELRSLEKRLHEAAEKLQGTRGVHRQYVRSIRQAREHLRN